jgi:hypothetical protein
MARHAVPSGIVNNAQVRSTLLNELRTDPGAGPGGDDGLAFLERGSQPLDNFFAGIRVSFSSPGIRHNQSRLNFAAQTLHTGCPPCNALFWETDLLHRVIVYRSVVKL